MCAAHSHTSQTVVCFADFAFLLVRPSFLGLFFRRTKTFFLLLFRWRSAAAVTPIPWYSPPRLRPSFNSSRGSKLTYCSSTRSIRNACVPRDWGRPAVAVAGGSFVVADGKGWGWRALLGRAIAPPCSENGVSNAQQQARCNSMLPMQLHTAPHGVDNNGGSSQRLWVILNSLVIICDWKR